MQIEIYNPTQAQPLPPITWNYAEVKQWVQDGLEAYKGRVYTEDMITAAKKDRAALNKLADAIDDKRKEMKKLYLEPFEKFEGEAKELISMIKAESSNIDAQVKAFEEQRKEDKLNKIKTELYVPMIGKLAELVPYERLHDPKWLNVSTSMSAVSEQLGNKIDRIESGLSSIDKLGLAPDIVEQVKGVFLKNYDLAAALAEKERIEKQREELARYEAAKAAVREVVQPVQLSEPVSERPVAPAPANDLYTVTFQVVNIPGDKLKALGEYMRTNNIKYRRA